MTVDDDVVRFAHPLWSAAAYSSSSRSRRRLAHRRLAAVTSDPEEQARHLALAASGPTKEVAAALEAAARAAVARGATNSAAELARLAARLSPDETARLSRSIAAARYLYEAGDAAQARQSLEELAQSAPGGPARARVLLALGQVREYDLETEQVLRILQEALDTAAGDDVLRAEIHLAMSWMCEQNLPAGLAHAMTAEELLAGRHEPGLLAEVMHAELMYENLCGNGMRANLVERARARAAGAACYDHRPAELSDRIDARHARRSGWRADVAARDAQRHPRRAARGWPVRGAVRSRPYRAAGRKLGRGAKIRAGRVGERRPSWARRCASLDHGGLEAEVDAVRGRVSEARAKAGEALRQSMAAGSSFGMLRVLPVLALSRCPRTGRPRRSVTWRRWTRYASESGSEPGRFRYHADYAEALIETGDLTRAAEVIDRLEDFAVALSADGGRWRLPPGAAP